MTEKDNQEYEDMAQARPPDSYRDGQNQSQEKEPDASHETISDEETKDKEEPGEEDDNPETRYNELNDKYLRLYSDFENFRRRNAKERLELLQTAGQEVITDLLPVLDDLERAIGVNKQSDNIKAIREGVELICQKFRETLASQGLKEIKAQGKPFDMDLHEAVSKMKAPSRKKKGKVLDVVEKGYYLNDKVIRYAKVVVGE